MRFQDREFADQGDVLVQDISILGVPPGKPMNHLLSSGRFGITVQYPGGDVEFHLERIDWDDTHEDIQGWNYRSPAGKRLLIIND